MGRSRSDIVRVAFNAGRLDPKMDARVDMEKAAIAARELRNMLLYVHGGTRRRPGLRFLEQAGLNAGPAELLLQTGAKLLLQNGGTLLLQAQ